jgi:hypothetical protein
MSRRDAADRLRAARHRIAGLKAQILQIEHLARGSLAKRMKRCGKPGCPCAADPAARHGPYFEWGRITAGDRASTHVTPPMAAKLAQAIENRRKLERLLRRWEALTLRALQAEIDANPDAAGSSIRR